MFRLYKVVISAISLLILLFLSTVTAFAHPAPTPVVIQAITATHTSRPVFTWTTPDDAVTATHFRVYVLRKVKGVASADIDLWIPRADVCGGPAGTTCTYTAPIDLVDNGSYHLLIMSYGAGGYSTGGAFGNGWAWREFYLDLDVPAVPANVTVLVNQGRPTLMWSDDALASRYYVYIRSSTTGATAYLAWHDKAGLCANGVCTLTTDAMNFSNGTYLAYLYACGLMCSVGGPFNNGWGGGIPFTLNFAAPGLVTGLNAAAAGTNVTVSFNGVPGATWYRVWLGTPDSAQVFFVNWVSSTTLNCQNAGLCQSTLTLPAPIPAGVAYLLSVRSVGPGGSGTGGIANTGWVVSSVLTAP